MLKVTAQGITELKGILEQMQCSGCGDEHAQSESDCGSHCHCGCEGHADVDDECAMGELALRLIVMGDHGFGLIPDIFRDGDQVIEYDGAKVLLVDREIAESVKGLTLDCVDVPGGRALTFIPGKA
jgi:Fe-S cluster assembly iron-binding protein IscA